MSAPFAAISIWQLTLLGRSSEVRLSDRNERAGGLEIAREGICAEYFECLVERARFSEQVAALGQLSGWRM